jgi:hypothetical protein
MMASSSDWDASIRLLDAVDDGTFFTLDEIALNTEFDVVAHVEIGENLNKNVDSFVLRVAVRNLTQSLTVEVVEKIGALTPRNNTPFFARERVGFAALDPARAAVGDVLQAVASYKVIAGANADTSTAESATFVVI